MFDECIIVSKLLYLWNFHMFDLKGLLFVIMNKRLMQTASASVHCIQVISQKLCWLITLDGMRVLCSYNPSLSFHAACPSGTCAAGSIELTR